MIRPRAALASLLALLAVAASACGPETPVEVGVKDYSTDIVYGAQNKPAPPTPIPAANPNPGFPSFIVPPPPAPSASSASSAPPLPPPTAVIACPEDDPFSFPAQPATGDVPVLPVAGTYSFRQQGTITVGDAEAQQLPPTSDRVLRNVSGEPGIDVTYDVEITSFGETTTTSYAVRQTTGDPSLDGIYITRIVTQRADGSVDEFSPLNGVRLLALPVGPAVSWSDVGTDPLRATSMVVQGEVVDKGRVNACGTVLDSWTVEVTGQLLGPGKDLALTATYQVGTQLGGIVLADHIRLSGTDGGMSVELESISTINDPVPHPLPADGEDEAS